MQWYYAKGNTQFGPVDETELFRLARAGQLAPTDLVWNPAMGANWAEASTVPNLVATPASTAPAAPPPPRAPGLPPSPPGQTHNRDLMRMARESLQNHWGIAIAATLVYGVILCGISTIVPVVGSIAALIIGGPLIVGLNLAFLGLVRKGDMEIGQVFAGFKEFGGACAAYLLTLLFTFLWALLFLIPGIVAGYSYSMTFFIIADDPTIQPLDAIRKSKGMMRGYKWKLFCMHWRFLGWSLLCILTCGIGFIWLVPYIQAAKTHFYEDVRPRNA